MIQRLQLDSLDAAQASGILRRSAVPDRSIRRSAEEICESVRRGGDAALAEYGDRFGGNRPDPRVSEQELATALRQLDQQLRVELESAIDNVRRVHRAQRMDDVTVEPVPGVTIERRWSPLRRIGAYVPGGKAAYPSTLIMTVVPAQLAGVDEIAIATPAAPDGSIAEVVLATAALLGITEMYAMGGAQAIAALAHGTETIPRVEKIVGPGNAWVTAGKLAVFGDVSIDLPAGPSEVLVIADDSADPRLVAIDLLCQAEHGPESPAILLSPSPQLFEEVTAEIEELLPELDRRDILAKCLADHARFVLVPDVATAVEIGNAYAAEHASLHTREAEVVADQLTAAGSVYVGSWSPESAGDYATGANHVLPTGGLGASHGPLSVADFGSWRQVQTLTEEGLRALAPTIARIAEAEGLTAHRLAALLRLEPQ